jgi:energy-coupling factor transport system permease protein
LITKTENGLYQPGQSLIHRLDPRIKVLSSLTLVVLAFAASDWIQLAMLLVVAAGALLVISPHAWLVLRVCSMLRWLLLFTLLMHLLLSPGRTLWGLSWLSLDGLYLGVFVCVQIALAATTTAILAITTRIEDLSASFGWFVKPLSRLGCRTDDWQKIILLALGFIPVVREEMHLSVRSEADCSAVRDQGWKGRWSAFCTKMKAFTERMLIRGDTMAHQIAANDNSCRIPSVLLAIWPLPLPDRCIVAAMMLIMACYWFAG